jgi:hypothetical protein
MLKVHTVFAFEISIYRNGFFSAGLSIFQRKCIVLCIRPSLSMCGIESESLNGMNAVCFDYNRISTLSKWKNEHVAYQYLLWDEA